MTVVELTDIKTTINWLLENGEFKDAETSYNIAMNSVDILEKQLSIPRVSKSFCECRPTGTLETITKTCCSKCSKEVSTYRT